MVIINTEPWAEPNGTSSSSQVPFHPPPPKEQEGKTVDEQLFKFQDLASDYYQVLRQKNRPRWCRVLWAIVVAGLFVMTGYLIFSLIRDYYRYESYNQSSMEWMDKVTLPAITICSSNFIDYTKMRKSLEVAEPEVLKQFEDAMDLLEGFDGVTNVLDAFDMSKLEALLEYEKERGSLILQFALDVTDMIIGTPHYYFQEIGRNVTDPKGMITATQMGLCLDINNDGALKQSVGGARGGFTIDLNTNLENYLPTTSSHGFILFMRDQKEMLMLDNGGYVVAPGTETSIKLKSKHVTRLGPPHGTCDNIESRFSKSGPHYESVQECQERQAIHAMIRSCGCIPQFFAATMWFSGSIDILDEALELIRVGRTQHDNHPLFQSPDPEEDTSEHRPKRASKKSDVHISDDEFLGYIMSPYFKQSCGIIQQPACEVLVQNMITKGEIQFSKCPEPCEYNEWEAAVASSPFPPTKQYFEKFLKSGKLQTFEQARESVTRLHVYYDEIRVNNEHQIKAYEPQNLVAEFGGTVDLFIGFSFFTVVQLIEIGVASCYFRLKHIIS